MPTPILCFHSALTIVDSTAGVSSVLGGSEPNGGSEPIGGSEPTGGSTMSGSEYGGGEVFILRVVSERVVHGGGLEGLLLAEAALLLAE